MLTSSRSFRFDPFRVLIPNYARLAKLFRCSRDESAIIETLPLEWLFRLKTDTLHVRHEAVLELKLANGKLLLDALVKLAIDLATQISQPTNIVPIRCSFELLWYSSSVTGV